MLHLLQELLYELASYQQNTVNQVCGCSFVVVRNVPEQMDMQVFAFAPP